MNAVTEISAAQPVSVSGVTDTQFDVVAEGATSRGAQGSQNQKGASAVTKNVGVDGTLDLTDPNLGGDIDALGGRFFRSMTALTKTTSLNDAVGAFKKVVDAGKGSGVLSSINDGQKFSDTLVAYGREISQLVQRYNTVMKDEKDPNRTTLAADYKSKLRSLVSSYNAIVGAFGSSGSLASITKISLSLAEPVAEVKKAAAVTLNSLSANLYVALPDKNEHQGWIYNKNGTPDDYTDDFSEESKPYVIHDPALPVPVNPSGSDLLNPGYRKTKTYRNRDNAVGIRLDYSRKLGDVANPFVLGVGGTVYGYKHSDYKDIEDDIGSDSFMPYMMKETQRFMLDGSVSLKHNVAPYLPGLKNVKDLTVEPLTYFEVYQNFDNSITFGRGLDGKSLPEERSDSSTYSYTDLNSDSAKLRLENGPTMTFEPGVMVTATKKNFLTSGLSVGYRVQLDWSWTPFNKVAPSSVALPPGYTLASNRNGELNFKKTSFFVRHHAMLSYDKKISDKDELSFSVWAATQKYRGAEDPDIRMVTVNPNPNNEVEFRADGNNRRLVKNREMFSVSAQYKRKFGVDKDKSAFIRVQHGFKGGRLDWPNAYQGFYPGTFVNAGFSYDF